MTVSEICLLLSSLLLRLIRVDKVDEHYSTAITDPYTVATSVA